LNYTLKLSKENYIKDYRNYLAYSRKKHWYFPIGILILSTVLFIISFFFDLNFDIRGVAFALTIFGATFLCFELIHRFKALKSINGSSQVFKFDTENLIIESTQIKISYGKVKYESIFFSQIQKCLMLSDAIFLILKKNEEWPYRINKSEISKEGFSELINNLNRRNIVVENK